MAPAQERKRAAEAAEDTHGSIYSVSGPVVVAENMIGCAMYELVCYIINERLFSIASGITR